MRRRALLAGGAAAGLTSLAGCGSVFDDTDRSGSTVNPQLQGDPTTGRPEAVAWQANTAEPQSLYPADDAVIVAEDDGRRFRALSTENGETLWTTRFEESRRARPGEVVVTSSAFGGGGAVGLDAATGRRLWEIDAPEGVSGLTSEVVVRATADNERTVVYDRRDGSRLWQTPPGERHLFRTTDPVVTFTDRPTTEAGTTTGVETATDPGPPSETAGTATGVATATPTPATPASTSDERPSRVQGRDPATGRLLWSIAAPLDARRAAPIGPHDGRLLLVGDEEYFLFGTAAGLVATGSLAEGLRPGPIAVAGDRVYFGDARPGAPSERPARLGWVSLADGTDGVRTVRGRSVRPLRMRDDRLLTAHWGDPGYGVVGREPADGSASWSVSGVPVGYRSGELIVGTPDEIRSHTPTGAIRWRADNSVGGSFGSLLGRSDGRTTGVVGDDWVAVVGEAGVASWGRDDGRSRSGFVPFDGLAALTTTDELVAVVTDGTVTAVEM